MLSGTRTGEDPEWAHPADVGLPRFSWFGCVFHSTAPCLNPKLKNAAESGLAAPSNLRSCGWVECNTSLQKAGLVSRLIPLVGDSGCFQPEPFDVGEKHHRIHCISITIMVS